MATAEQLDALLRPSLEPAALAWWDRALSGASSLHSAFAGAGRRLGTERIEVEGHLWTKGEIGRVALILGVAEHAEATVCGGGSDTLARVLDDLYYRGELGEKAAVMRALPHLPDPGPHLALAVEAVRTNTLDVFEAIACHNPFPARFFEDDAFNQLVLKALFMEVPVARIEGLQDRTSPELLRMADAFASEREAAGRTVPSDITLLHELARGA